MKIKYTQIFLLVFISFILLAGAFAGGVIVGWGLPNNQTAQALLTTPDPSGDTAQTNATAASPEEQENLDVLFEPFWQAWDIVHDQYLIQPVDDTVLMQGAIRGMLDSLEDPYTAYMDPVEYQEQQTPLDGEYEGIGVWVDTSGEYLTIISAIPDTPAEEAGLLPGDQIIGVDGEDVTGIDGTLVIRKILGPAGTSVELTIKRESEDPFLVEIKRARVIVPSVDAEIIDGNIAYIQLGNFGDRTGEELHSTLKDLLREDPAGLIIDLRYNGGGYLDTAVEVLSEFFERDTLIMYEEFSDGTRNTLTTSNKGQEALDIPLVILVNEGTASASEITAGAIQDYERGWLVGTTTFGKGLVQTWAPLVNDQGAVRVTIARWLTPNARQIHGTGLTPDFVVEITEEDILNDLDPQLEKAIELLTQNE